MRMINLKAILKTAIQGATVLLLGASMAGAQQVNLTAAPSTAALPDGSILPMWGYSCGAAVTNSTATCSSLNPNAGAGWSPVVITVPMGAAGGLTINLTNSLTFANGNSVPTSIMIVGQVGGGLGSVTSSCNGTSTTGSTCTTSPDHSALSSNSVSWPIAGAPGSFTPPPQGPRVQSFGTEVATIGPTGTKALTWTAPRAGTYLLESGTHPSIQATMGLIGVLVVTTAPTASAGLETAAGTAYPGVSYNAEIPLLFSEIDPRQIGVEDDGLRQALNAHGPSRHLHGLGHGARRRLQRGGTHPMPGRGAVPIVRFESLVEVLPQGIGRLRVDQLTAGPLVDD